MADAIIKTVEVNCSPEHAFNVFVNRISSWWPLESHAVSASDGKAARMVTIEPFVGGAIFETKHDGARADWGQVLEIDPGFKIAVTWHPGTNTDKPTRVDVEFEAAGEKTRVTLTHSGWEIWADEASDRIQGYTAGWGAILGDLFRPACEDL